MLTYYGPEGIYIGTLAPLAAKVVCMAIFRSCRYLLPLLKFRYICLIISTNVDNCL